MRKRVFGVFIIMCVCLIFPLSAHAMTRDQAVNWAKSQVGVAYNVDGINGYQCSDFGSAYINYIIYGDPYYWRNTGGKGYTTYMGYNYYGLTYPSGWQKIANTASFVPEPGDIICFAGNSSNSAGHVAVAIEGSTVSVMYGLGQNGKANNGNGEAVKRETLPYYGSWGNIQGVIRPKWDNTDTTKPTINGVWFSNITETSFNVNVEASDSNGMAQIGCTTWSAKNGKDDQEWKANVVSGTPASTSLSYSISNHSSTTGTYLVSITVHDSSWNSTTQELEYGPFVGPYLDIGNSFTAIIKNTKVGKVLTCDNNGKVTSKTYAGSSNQWWTFTKQSDNKSYKIQNVATGLCLDVDNGSTSVAAGVLGYKSHDGNNQKWYIQGSENAYRLRAKSGWCVLDLYGLNTSEGAAYDMYGSNDSDAQKFTITKLVAAKPAITTSNVAGGKNVKITTSTSGATIYYTTNGSNPTTSSTKYTGEFKVTSNTTVKAIAIASGYANSAVASASVSVSAAAKPAITTANVAGGKLATLTTTTIGATIYYTTDGSNPTTSSHKYTEPFIVRARENTVVKAIAVANGYTNSEILNITITVTKTAAPNIKADGAVITITSSANGAAIYYTTDGSNPTTSSAKYTEPFTLNKNAQIKAIAAADGYTVSDVISYDYIFYGSVDIDSSISSTKSYYNVFSEITNPVPAVYGVAFYDSEGAFMDFKTKNITEADTEVTMRIPRIEGAALAKVFVWNDADNMYPFAQSAEIELN